MASDDAYFVTAGATLTVTAPGVLGNDTDAEGSTLTASLVSGPVEGSLTLNSDGSFSFDSTGVTASSVTFTYTASDGTATSNVAIVTVTIGNTPPVAADDTGSVSEDTPLVLSAPGVLGNDTDANGDSLTTVARRRPGERDADARHRRLVTYTPDPHFHGTDGFTSQASDGQAASVTASVVITVTPVNDLPAAADDSFEVVENGSLVSSIGVLANDTDADGESLAAVLVAGPSNGSIPLSPDGSFTYTPDFAFVGTDVFTYQASDGTGSSNVATATIVVAAAPRSNSLKAGYCSAAGGILPRAPSPWVSQDLVGLAADDIGFYVDLTISRIDRDLDFLEENDGTLVFVGAGTDIMLVRDDTWQAAFQAGLQYGWFGGVDETDEGIAVALGLLGGVQVATSFWITVNPQIAFADAGDQVYFLHLGANIAF